MSRSGKNLSGMAGGAMVKRKAHKGGANEQRGRRPETPTERRARLQRIRKET